MEEFKFRTLTDEEVDCLVALEQNRKNHKNAIFSTIGESIFCLLTLAVIGLFIWQILTLRNCDIPNEYNISKFNFVNLLCWCGERCTDTCPLIYVASIFAALFELFGQFELNSLFNNLPLGSMPKELINILPEINPLSAFIPTLISSCLIIVNVMANEVFPQIKSFYTQKLLPIGIVLIAITLLILFLYCLFEGGIYGLLIRGSLICIANFGLSVLFGIIGSLITGIISLFFVLLVCIIVISIVLRLCLIAM